MKMAYRNWHKELNVNDDVIKGDLNSISKGVLSMDPDEAIDVSSNAMTSTNSYKKKSNSYYSNNNRRDGRNNRRNNNSGGGGYRRNNRRR